MTVEDLKTILPLAVVAGGKDLTAAITGGYTSDLLSNVMGQAQPGAVWVTLQGHQNIIAVASLIGLSAVIVAGGVEPDSQAIHKAGSENIPLLTTSLPAFEVVGRIYQAGIKGI